MASIVQSYFPEQQQEEANGNPAEPPLNLVLLSDESQSSIVGAKYPNLGLTLVRLDEVVRSTKRAVSGSMAFQQGEHNKQHKLRCHHNSNGPPRHGPAAPCSGRGR